MGILVISWADKKMYTLRKKIFLRPKNWFEQCLFGIVLQQKRVKPYFIHCAQDQDYDARFDTLMMPSGSIAALTTISEALRKKYDFLEPAMAIDESYPAPGVHGQEREFFLQYLHEQIENNLSQGITPAIYCSVYSYNAEQSLNLLQTLKAEFGSRIRTGVGGQLIRVNPAVYQSLPFIDHVGVGDAEVILETLLVAENRYAEGYLQLTSESGQHYARFTYDNYLGLHERLESMSKLKHGPFANFRQLAVESVRGCSWANLIGKPCEM